MNTHIPLLPLSARNIHISGCMTVSDQTQAGAMERIIRAAENAQKRAYAKEYDAIQSGAAFAGAMQKKAGERREAARYGVANQCVSCGREMPEGDMVCRQCREAR